MVTSALDPDREKAHKKKIASLRARIEELEQQLLSEQAESNALLVRKTPFEIVWRLVSNFQPLFMLLLLFPSFPPFFIFLLFFFFEKKGKTQGSTEMQRKLEEELAELQRQHQALLSDNKAMAEKLK